MKLRLIRLLASGVDAFLGILLGLVLANSAIGAFFAERAVVMLHIGSAETIWKGPVLISTLLRLPSIHDTLTHTGVARPPPHKAVGCETS